MFPGSHDRLKSEKEELKMITGYLLLILCVILVGGWIARKMGAKAVNKFFAKIHTPIGILAILLTVLHLVLTHEVWKTRSDAVVGTGIFTAIAMVAMTVVYYRRKTFGTAWLRYHRIGALVVVAILISHMVTYFVDYSSYQSKLASIQVQGMTAKGVADGKYLGECNVGFIYAKVEVTVQGEEIQDIQLLEHKNERGKKAERLIDEMRQKKTTGVDTVSGASNSSRVITKAVENALKTTKGK